MLKLRKLLRRNLSMRRTGCVIPNGDDQNVYLMLDDLGRNGRVWREIDAETADLETVILDLIEVSTKARFGSSLSTPLRNGRRMSRQTLRMSCAGAVICNCATCHFSSKNSSTDTKAVITTFSFPFRSAWFEKCQKLLPVASRLCTPAS
jgi:hypothetical protein